MSEPGFVGIWRKVLPMSDFKFGVAIVHLHASGRAARILYSFRPFHDLDARGPTFGHWKAGDGHEGMMKLDSEDDEFRLRYIPDYQLEVRFLAGREVYERATAQEISVTHLNLVSGVDFNEQIRAYLEHGITMPKQNG
jgi:hypothetical protein